MKKILVAIEQSQYSDKALAQAVEMAKRDGAELTALTVAETIHDIEELFPGAEAKVKLLARAKETSEKAKAFASSRGVTLTAIVETNVSPESSILEYSKANDVDLIVMGSRAKKGIEKFLIGSVASKVMAYAPCSVMVVR